MPTPPLADAPIQQAVDALLRAGNNKEAAARGLGLPISTFKHRLETAARRRIKPRVADPNDPKALRGQIKRLEMELAAASEQKRKQKAAKQAPVILPASDLSKQESLRTLLRRGTFSIPDICEQLATTAKHAKGLLQALRGQGFLVAETTGGYTIHTTPAPVILSAKHIYKSRPGGYYKFGYTTDNHLCSKYAREDVLSDLYDWFAAEKVDRVFNTGNYIDGEARFNTHDIHTHGMQNQLDYFCTNYPKRKVDGKPLVTYIVSGDDHEGWYGQREGIDIGWLMEQTAKDKFGREDLVNLGYIESFIRLQHYNYPKLIAHLLAVHPGGGSAYATSYAPQKYVEALQGGEKPAVILFGHWHKMFDLLIRSVICLGGGCTKDLDTFGRKMKLAYHIGGMIVELWQDQSGAITRWRVEKKQYFDRGYYNEQWSYAGKPARTPA